MIEEMREDRIITRLTDMFFGCLFGMSLIIILIR